MADGVLPSPEGLAGPLWQAVLWCLTAAENHTTILQA